MSIDEYLISLKNLESSLNDEISKVIKEKQGFLVGLIKNRLYQKGIDAFGKQILPTYSKSTIEEKKLKNQRVSHVTLRDKGDFYNSIFVEIKDFVLKVWATDDKTEGLIFKYGEGILGFTKDEQDIIILGIIEPHIQKIINSLNKGKIDI
jgi:hypothetical protein